MHNDLTQRRFGLLKYAQGKADRAMARKFPNKEERDRLPLDKRVFVFANIQSDLKFRVGKMVHSFNTYNEFDRLFAEEFPEFSPGRGGDQPSESQGWSRAGRGGRRRGGTVRCQHRSPICLTWPNENNPDDEVQLLMAQNRFGSLAGTTGGFDSSERRGRSPTRHRRQDASVGSTN